VFFSEKVRLRCGEPGCEKTFCDPSARSKHHKKYHRPPEESTAGGITGGGYVSQFAMRAGRSRGAPLAYHCNPSQYDAGQPSASHGALSISSSSVYRPSYVPGSTHCEFPGVFHHATGVQTDCRSIDNNIQFTHQEAYYDAHHPEAAQSAWGHAQDVLEPPYPSMQETLTFRHPAQRSHPWLEQGELEADHTGRSCRCSDCVVEGPILLAPLRGYQHERIEAGSSEREASSFLIPRTGHVPHDDQLSAAPNHFYSSEYPPPNPRMLF
jgi:hypothetical protein